MFQRFLKFKIKPELNQVNLLLHRNVSIHLGFRQTKQNFCDLFPNFFLPVRNVLVCSKLLRNQNRTFGFFKNYIKTFQIVPELFKDKTKLLVVSKNFWKRTRTKAFFWNKFFSTDRKRLVLFQNFVSKMNIFNIFWNKSNKAKPFNLERTV